MIIRWRKVLKRYVPGIISGGADNDPSGISTYSISGAQFGYQQLWLLVLSTPMLIAIQAMCARLGDVKQKGLMSIIREHYSPFVSVTASIILVITCIATLAADLAAVADSIGLLTNTPFPLWVVPTAAVLWYLIVFKNYKIIEKYLFFLSFIFLSYIASGFFAHPQWLLVFQSVLKPSIRFSPPYFIAALGLLGTTITPFLFFWQSKQETEENIESSELRIRAKKEDKILAPGFIYSNIISIFIIISSASVLGSHGVHDIQTARQAAMALEPVAGRFATVLFAIGIIGSGFLAIPVLAASSAYIVAETFGWRDSLSDKLNKAKGFYTIISASILVGIAIALSGIDPIKALLYSQVLNGILGPFIIVLILFMCNDKKIMGPLVNGWFDNLFGWLSAIVLVLGSAGLFWQLFNHY